MKPKMKKIVSSALALVLALVFVTGASEVVGMLGGSPVTAQVLGSDGDQEDQYSGSSTSSSSTKKTTKKKANSIKVSGKTVSISATKIASKKKTIARKKAIKVSKAKGKVTYKKKSGPKKISINSSGKITVKKGLKAGHYKLKVKVKAAGNSKYKPGSKTATVTIKVTKDANTLSLVDTAVTISSTDQHVISSSQYVEKVGKGTTLFEITESDSMDYISIDSSTGNINISSDLTAGTYTVKVQATAAGNSTYKKKIETASINITIQ